MALRAQVAFPAALALAGLTCSRAGRSRGRRARRTRVEPVVLAPPAGPDGALTIAAVFPTIGRYAVSGRQSLQGARLAVEERNRAGGVHGRPLRLLEYRTGSYFVDVRHAAELRRAGRRARDRRLELERAQPRDRRGGRGERRRPDLERLDGGRPHLGPADGPPAASCSGCAPRTT